MKANFVVYDWAHEGEEGIRKAGFAHNELYNGDPFRAARKLFDAGLNVMVYHVADSPAIILFVDTKKFQQR